MAAGSAFDPSTWKKAFVGVAVVAGTVGISWWTAYNPGSGGTGGGGGGGGAARVGNVFVATTGNDSTCARSSSQVTFANAAGFICATFDKAYHVANSGDQVVIEGGSYAAQNMTADGTKNSTVTMIADTGATVTVAGGQFGTNGGGSGPTWVTLNGLTLTGDWTWWAPSAHDTITNSTEASGASFDMEGGSNNTLSNSTMANCGASAGDACTMRLTGTGETVNNVVFHDLYSTNNTLYHQEGIFVRGCTSCTIKNSTFYNIDSTANVFIQDCCSLPNNNGITIVNNWFGPHLQPTGPDGSTVLCFTCEPDHNAIEISSGGSEAGNGAIGVVIAFNSAYDYCDTSLSTTYLTTAGRCGGFINCTSNNTNCGTSTSSAQVYGNLLAMPSVSGGGNPASCFGDVTYQYNVFYPDNSVNGENGPCPGTGNVLHTSSLFPYTTQPVGTGMQTTAPNYTITGATWDGDQLVPAALCANFPTDKNGNQRGAGGTNCDAGATER